MFRSPVYSVSVHPSGKLGLSLGKDKTLRTWNLMTAKTAYVTNIKQGQYLFYYITNVKVFNKHISGKAAGFRPKAGSCAYSLNHSQTNMADQNCNLGNDPQSKHRCQPSRSDRWSPVFETLSPVHSSLPFLHGNSRWFYSSHIWLLGAISGQHMFMFSRHRK